MMGMSLCTQQIYHQYGDIPICGVLPLYFSGSETITNITGGTFPRQL